MKVIHIFWGLTYGGIETMLVNIVNEQVKLNLEVSLMVINNSVELELQNRIRKEVHLIKIDRKRGTYCLSFIKRINEALVTLKPDIIHLHRSEIRDFINSNILNTVRVVSTVHDIPSGRLGYPFRWARIIEKSLGMNPGNVCALDKIDHVFSISKTVADNLLNRYGIKSNIVYNGILSSNFLPRNNELPGKVFRIAQVSRLEHYKKGQDLLIEAIYLLKTVYGLDVSLTFIGEGTSRLYLQNLVKQKNLADQVTFLGAQSQTYLENHLKDYDLFIQPSRVEGFGLTVAEAMTANVPVLITDDQGPAEITEGSRYGWLFKNGDYKSLASEISRIINNYQEAIKKSNLGKIYVKNKFDVSVTAKMYVKKYMEIINV